MNNRRGFLLAVGALVLHSGCSQSNPTAPSPITPTNNRVQPSLAYIRYGWALQPMSLLEAIREHNPILSNYQPAFQDYFVEGFQGTRQSSLVFYIDNQRFDDRGVSKKMLDANQLWGVMQA